MKLTLRAARKLETKISKFIAEREYQPVVSISIYTEFANELYNTKRADYVSRIEMILDLIDIRYHIRRAIQESNESAGVNDLTTKRKLLADKALFLERDVPLDQVRKNSVDHQALWKKLSVMVASGPIPSEYGRVEDSVSFPLMSVADIDTLVASRSSFRKQVEEIDEQLLGINSTVKIELTDSAVDTLKVVNLI